MTTTEHRPAVEHGVVVVARSERRANVGQGIAKGMGVVIKHFADALLKRNDSKADISGMFTVQYPEELMVLPETFRNMPILLFDDATGHELCTSCFQCERVCPPQVIHITQAKHPETGKPVPAVQEFVVEYDSCMSCGYCAEVCPFDAIKMDHYFELATPDHLAMDVHKVALNRPVSYYEALAPTLWAQVRETALKKLQNNIKRRPGLIGVAPQAQGKATSAAARVAPGAAPGAQARPSGAPARPVAAIGKSMPAEKVARLEAIRAANRAAAGGAGETVAIDAGAANLHQQQIVAPEEPIDSAGPAAGTPASAAPGGDLPPAGASMPDDKQARLEAIRAANRAKREGGA